MIKTALPTIAALGIAACAQTPAETARAAQDAAATQSGLDRALAGLRPVGTSSCLNNFQNPHLQAYGRTLVYAVSNGRKYRSDTAGGCESVARGDILVTTSPQGRVCAGDIAQTIDRTARFPTGSCAIGEFTEYRRP